MWLGIPGAERQQILANWTIGIVGQEHSPVVYLPANYDRPGNNDGFGNSIKLNSGVSDLLVSADFLLHLIAHELARVYRYATQAQAHVAFPPNNAAKNDKADVKQGNGAIE